MIPGLGPTTIYVVISLAAQKMTFSIKDFFSKFDQIRIRSHSLKKSLMENFSFGAVFTIINELICRSPPLAIIMNVRVCQRNACCKKKRNCNCF